MASLVRCCERLRLSATVFRVSTFVTRQLCSSQDDHNTSHGASKIEEAEIQSKHRTPASGLEKAMDMFQRVQSAATGETIEELPSKRPSSFAQLLRRSKLMHIGDPSGRVVIGTIVETLNDDLYIDFGGKFECVCKKPKTRPDDYRRGAKVRIRLHDLEMSSRFLGAERDVTLLEADATLLGLYAEGDTRTHGHA